MTTDASTAVHEGGCVCGATRYRVEGEPLRVTICHCLWCQRRTGSGFAVEAVFANKQVAFSGATRSRYRHVSDESGRWLEIEFCPTCATALGFTLEAAPGIRAVEAGTFDDPGWISAKRFAFRHVFTRSHRDWSEIPAGAETYETHFRR